MNIIVCNIGSTSFKFQLIDMNGEQVLAKCHIERVGSENAQAVFYRGTDEKTGEEEHPVPDQRHAVKRGLAFLEDEIVDDLSIVDAVGFKAVQAGERSFTSLIDDDVLHVMEEYNDLAPAHNPAYIEAMRMFGELMPGKPLVGVFEPGFHVDKPDYAAVYGAPYEWYEKYGVRRYGYHGASLRYVTGETVRRLNLDPDNHRIVACHLGGSSSVCAYKNSVSIDTSMGFTPQSGLIQSSRTGDIDAFVVPYIMRKTGKSMEEVYRELGSNGGLKGLSGVSGDMRDINAAIERGDARAKLARDKFIYDIKFYMGAYILLMEGLDAVCFTGGTGQKDADLRRRVLSSISFLGFRMDERANSMHRERIDADGSSIAALVLETNEEIIVARETMRIARQTHE